MGPAVVCDERCTSTGRLVYCRRKIAYVRRKSFIGKWGLWNLEFRKCPLRKEKGIFLTPPSEASLLPIRHTTSSSPASKAFLASPIYSVNRNHSTLNFHLRYLLRCYLQLACSFAPAPYAKYVLGSYHLSKSPENPCRLMSSSSEEVLLVSPRQFDSNKCVRSKTRN
jgi:hypothetical protein